ncbi:MAG: DUF2779 domain-containing protein [Flammeovirgaceae bacterium]|nr:DUF2779 domain-containing protein [Flammeovirgaceae bacterium]
MLDINKKILKKREALTLSKTDFKVASTCAQKLVYRKQNYPNNLQENEFMKLLADGGYMIGAMANLLYPGTEITGSTLEALEQTRILLQQDEITLHEAAIQSGQKLVRIDILMKRGNRFELIEVKSKSSDSSDDKAAERKNMETYIEDAVYQTLVLKEVYPNADIDTFLLLPDKDKRTNIDGLASWFKVEHQEQAPDTRFLKPVVNFKYEGQPQYADKIMELRQDGLLTKLPLNEHVERRIEEIRLRADGFIDILNNNLHCPAEQRPLNKDCKHCEYQKIALEGPSGFDECWGALGEEDPHVFDLYHGGTIGGYKNPLINQLIAEEKTSLWDFLETDFVDAKGGVGARNERQLIQYLNTLNNTEWFSETMVAELNSWKYPLHFIDFETYTGALPLHAHMCPYEVLAFQFSCHTIAHADAEPIHTEWINTEPGFPGFRFAEALMHAIGSEGTPLMWATHENTVLRGILKQMETMAHQNPVLKRWLLDITKDEKENRPGRLVDMNAFTLKHYFHPFMKGKTSIKKTLPAVWKHHPYLHQIPWFKKYYQVGPDGEIQDPYQALKTIFVNSTQSQLATMEIEEVVNEGCAAMKAYYELQFGDHANRQSLKQQLLAYCELDTMAMVMIWTHWYRNFIGK